ncbi:tuberoinfundibular peptide of 39 residues isoform X2 [Girardinichthys multiradiatus]|uniref:tuberoinfundibular peptide of 39 residues isoform X2 n=1 Tax=Girardinichthys multiradiatus TaxID=208333 RepID=UPI001FADB061|nr:tuberoinfundibular peptide of 39 residues isoform X2 [Girardinichthys multiradiatus]
MSELLAFSRISFLLIWVLVISSMTSGFPQPRLPLRNPDDPQEVKRDDWEVLFPSISLHDWNIQMMSAPSLKAAGDSKADLMREAWLFAPERMEASVEGVWPTEWASEGARLVKRNMVVADDAAFREKSKLLTSMERQKWLNSYMQKLLP